MADPSEQDALIGQFTAIASTSTRQAQQFLAASEWNLETALANYYAAQEDHVDDNADDSDYVDEDDPEEISNQSHPQHGSGRRLGEGPVDPQPIPVASTSDPSQSKKTSGTQKKFATLSDVNAGGANAGDSDDDEKHDLFAGGEKSGLAVQNPDDLKKRILEKAQKRGPPPKEDAPKKTHFTGSARTLGGDDAPSREIPSAPQPRARAERVERVLHFWQDGFSIDDGDLYRIDDPRNAEILNLIRQGRAPLNIMNVQPGQEVDVEIKQHDEKYVKPKKKYKPFGGSGQRLGSPTPGGMSSPMPGSFAAEPAAPAAPATAGPPTANVDESKPTVTLRISLGSGTRLTSRFNTTQTIGDVYDFVQRAEPGGRDFVLQTTFPTNELTDKTKVLGDMAEFKRGGAIVQKYT
ncbi:protein phosphatase regulator [Exophiala sideris]|uniref:Protein phosphatase regulator n=1 Tax=Exophiala sideris TaxID=1016849 RepID=A0ABR0JGA7_9EURO|nr:protein phosphatase regulator [Exophiala sideris]KAK5063750.1 protein phosphatase regulator [Exophiala sideris]